ncbi:hypothetical protein D3C87_2108400 [compost metagenome]
MRDDNQPAGVSRKRFFHPFPGVNIEIIGRLIQYQQVSFTEIQTKEGHPAFLAQA